MSTPPARKSNKARHRGTRGRVVADAQQRASQKRKQRWLTCVCAGVVVCVATTVGLLILTDSVVSATPVWWSPPDGASAESVAIATGLERRVTQRMTLLRDVDERWVIEVTEDEASSWFASRLPVWMESEGVEWPLAGRPFDLSFERGRVLVGVPMTGAWQRRRERVVVAELGLRVDADGGLVVHLEGVTLGRLSLPDAWAKGHLEAAASRAALDPSTVGAVMRGDAALRSASLAIDAHRMVRIESIDVREGLLALTCVTQPRATAQR